MATVTKPLMLDETGQDILNKLDDILIATPVVDNCSTADPVKALSANQGKILNETTVKFTNESVGSVTPINADQLNGHTDEYFAKAGNLGATVIWEGDIHAEGVSGQTTENINNFLLIMFVFNVIPSRTPNYDVVADQSIAIPQIRSYDLSSANAANLSAFCLTFNDYRNFSTYRYTKASTSSYNPGLVRILGLIRINNN